MGPHSFAAFVRLPAGHAAAGNDMKTYTRYILSLLLLSGILLLSGGCRKSVLREGEPGLSPEDTALVDISFLLRYDKMATKAGTVDVETRISNLNLFFVHDRYPSPGAPEVRHYYFDLKDQDVVGVLNLSNIRLGGYTLYAVANSRGNMCGTDHTGSTSVSDNLCSMTRDQIEAAVVQAVIENGNTLLLMTAKQVVTVKKYDQLLPLSLTRRSAKVEFNYTVTEKGQQIGMQFQSIYLQSTATAITPFSEALPTRFSRSIYSVQSQPIAGSLVCYPMENKQGEGTNFSGGAMGRTGLYAPADATYFYLSGNYRGDDGQNKQVGFSIYLGEDLDGNNFDVTGNRHYQVNAYFNGIDPNDNRISWISIDPGTKFDPAVAYENDMIEARDILVNCKNCYNDQLYLYPQVLGAMGMGEFHVFVTGEDGVEREVTSAGVGRYLLLESGATGVGEVRCRVTYKHDMAESIQLALTLKNNFGDIEIFTQPVIFQ